MAGKFALIMGTSEYEDPNLARLKAPDADVNVLSALLRDSQIGAFDEVITLANELSGIIRRAIALFFAQKAPDDLLLLYFSGHGVLDDRGELFLATKDTERELISGTAIPATYITSEMDRSRSKRQVLILDCCHSGAFSRGSKGVVGASVGTAAAFQGIGYGRAVLTATDATQYAWEGDQVIGQAENSLFTHYLIEGLRTGEADVDMDGRITLDNLYDYVYGQVVKATPKQTPGKWSYKQQGEIVIAINPKPVIKPAELPRELRDAIESPLAGLREGAIHELERLLRGTHPGLALSAHNALKQLAEDDSRRVANVALEAIRAYEDAERAKEAVSERMEQERAIWEKQVEEVAKEKTGTEPRAREEAGQRKPAQKQTDVVQQEARPKLEPKRSKRVISVPFTLIVAFFICIAVSCGIIVFGRAILTSMLPTQPPHPVNIISNAVMSKDVSGDNFDPVNITDSFPDNQSIFHAVVTISGAPNNTQFKAAWFMSDDRLMGEFTLTSSGSHNLDFTFKPNNGTLPAGNYKVKIYVDGTLNRTLTFSVSGSPQPPPTSSRIQATCSSASPKASGYINQVIMAEGTQGANKQPVNPTTTFNSLAVFHAVVSIQNAPANTDFKATWCVVNAGSTTTQNSVIDSTDLTTDGSRNIDFALSPSTTWPTGTYRVVISVNGVVDTVKSFSVE